MFTKKLLYSDTVNSSTDLRFRLNYYITRDSSRLRDDNPTYGIIVEKEGGDATEVYEAGNCMLSYEEAESILAALHVNTVSPACAEETMEIILVQQKTEDKDDAGSASVA